MNSASQVILVTIPAAPFTADMSCLATVVARADIDWTFRPLRSYLDPIDSGATGGARGAAELNDDRLAAYTVVPGDLIEEVVARFGLTVDDLSYLNNSRTPNAQQQTLRVGERLNLPDGPRNLETLGAALFTHDSPIRV